jgi:hypothetical protein
VTSRRQLTRQIRSLLSELGSSHQEVAATLHRAGIRAVPKHPDSCAVAMYLGAILGADSRIQSVTVGSNCLKAATMSATPFYFYGTMLIPVPKAVGQFIAAFDEGLYPELVREDATIDQGGQHRPPAPAAVPVQHRAQISSGIDQ